MKNYILMHTHKHGITYYLFRSNRAFSGYYDEENEEPDFELQQVLSGLGIYYEPDRNESLEIEQGVEGLKEFKF